ncbi:MAG: hypothetical protein LBP85_08095 [Prevotellaceae bacterium]|jgi:tetratricopeptide (TPR) repeat protein|nr:hypothetical protein [Prevotellaceae bacterium]
MEKEFKMAVLVYDNYKEEETNAFTKKLHELTTQGAYEHSRGLDTTKTHEEVIKIYNKIPENERTGEQTRCAVAALILNKMDESRLLLDKWQNIGKDDEQWNVQYGWTYYLEKNYKEAIPYLEKVAEDLHDTDQTILGYLSKCNENIGNKEEVKRIKKRIREIDNWGNSKDNFKKEKYYKK